MSDLKPLRTIPALTAIGAEDAGMCVDGVCAVPAPERPELPEQTDLPGASSA